MPVEKMEGFTLGAVIAFLAPGFIAFNALAYQVPWAAKWLAAAQSADHNVGIFLFVALASLALGILVSGIRALVFDPICKQDVFGATPITLEPPDFHQLRQEDVRAAFSIMVENYYRYYQFYSNSFIALTILWVSHLTSPMADQWGGLNLVIAFTLIALFLSARDSLTRLSNAATKLFNHNRAIYE